MCGIAGFYASTSTLDPRLQTFFSKALFHRGPDGEGIFETHTSSNCSLLLLHRRLSIVDLEHGHQPLIGQDPLGKEAVLILNGEIYNQEILRKKYPSYPFKTQSDCEPLLPLYFEKGEKFDEDLRGMYAFALYDKSSNALILGRDPFGIKPLYYRCDETGFAFASEITALLFPWDSAHSLDTFTCNEVLNLQFSCGRKTMFPGICRLLPGEMLWVSDGKIKKSSHLAALNYKQPSFKRKTQQALQELEKNLLETLQGHLMADVPVGLFYSKGVDSSVLLRGLNLLGHKEIPAFHLIFEDEKTSIPDDFPLKAHFKEILFQEEDFWKFLPLAAFIMDDFAADYALLPTLKLSQAAQQQGLKVILSGEGGDEIFAGYGRYKKAIRWRLFGGKSLREKSLLQGFDLFKAPSSWRSDIIKAEQEISQYKELSSLQKAQALDIKDWLPHDLMIKLDRTLMHFGIEGRPPFLDKVFANFGFFLEDSLKLYQVHGKWILKKWLQKQVGLNFFEKKKGFTPPVGHWISKKAYILGPLLKNQEALKELFPQKIEDLFKKLSQNPTLKKEGMAAWVLLFYTLWYKIQVEKISWKEDVFDILKKSS
ncbi:MAG: asparagine synthase (glutamine-hydrolyzing) [Proteobacteria bacterium]|nr:asparagine synthase (glutamine-hydrolyzing) [Pseudomonadota bacterium]